MLSWLYISFTLLPVNLLSNFAFCFGVISNSFISSIVIFSWFMIFVAATTTHHSPFKLAFCKLKTKFCALFLNLVSNFFVASLIAKISLVGSSFAISYIKFKMRFGDSYITTGYGEFRAFCKAKSLSLLVFGKKPKKLNSFSTNPLAATAKSKAFDPLNTS